MANFETTIDNTQKVLATVSLTKADGTPVTVDGLLLTPTSGDATFSMVDSSGNPLPTAQVYIVSGPTVGDSTFDVTVQNAVRVSTATITAHVIEGVLSVSISFATPEPK